MGIPSPTKCDVSKAAILSEFPKCAPRANHVTSKTVFPFRTPQYDDGHTNQVKVVSKTYGSAARHEIITRPRAGSCPEYMLKKNSDDDALNKSFPSIKCSTFGRDEEWKTSYQDANSTTRILLRLALKAEGRKERTYQRASRKSQSGLSLMIHKNLHKSASSWLIVPKKPQPVSSEIVQSIEELPPSKPPRHQPSTPSSAPQHPIQVSTIKYHPHKPPNKEESNHSNIKVSRNEELDLKRATKYVEFKFSRLRTKSESHRLFYNPENTYLPPILGGTTQRRHFIPEMNHMPSKILNGY